MKEIYSCEDVYYYYYLFNILPQNTNNDKKQGSHTKTIKVVRKPIKETMGLTDIGLPQSKK